MKPELLVPCHDFATLKAAVEAGADAVYFGVKNFNMRLKAGNFELSELPRVIKYCHENEVRAYLTVNVVVYEDELEEVRDLLTKARGIDAVIVHDISTLKLAQELGLEVHVSTQANISNSVSANVYAELGASRVILARELSLEQVRVVAKNSRVPVEVFVHGAMCVSISGRCFFSQAMYGKNANRGECYQPCRQSWIVKNKDGEFVYDGERFLNSKDLCMIEHMPQLLDLGVASFKIEGRMKDANYVSTVTKCYREAIDDFDEGKVKDWVNRLSSVFNRGFCTGFYFGEPEESGVSGNQSGYSKEFIGEVTNYYKEPGVAEVFLKAGDLKLSDEVIIESNDDFVKQEVNSLEVDKKPVKKVNKGGKVGLKTTKPVRKGASVYKLVKFS